jgi:hypothetical protein
VITLLAFFVRRVIGVTFVLFVVTASPFKVSLPDHATTDTGVVPAS